LDHVPSFEGGLLGLPYAAPEQDLRLAAIARRQQDHPALVSDVRLVAAPEVVQARRSDHFTRSDGNLAGVASEIGLDEAPLVEGAHLEQPLGLLHWLDAKHVLQQELVRALRPRCNRVADALGGEHRW
jgi:hypothetical protein